MTRAFNMKALDFFYNTNIAAKFSNVLFTDYTKALNPVIDLPTISELISLVPSYE